MELYNPLYILPTIQVLRQSWSLDRGRGGSYPAWVAKIYTEATFISMIKFACCACVCRDRATFISMETFAYFACVCREHEGEIIWSSTKGKAATDALEIKLLVS